MASPNFSVSNFAIINNRPFALASIFSSRLSSTAIALESEGKRELSTAIRSLATKSYAIVEAGIASATGTRKIQEVAGRGLKVDLIKVNTVTGGIETQEVKASLLKYIINNSREITPRRERAIELGSPIRIGADGAKELTIGYSVNPDTGAIQEEVQTIEDSERFFRYYKDKRGLLKEHLSAPSKQKNLSLRKVLQAISKNLTTKALTLTIPLTINAKQSAITTLQFKKEFILRTARISLSRDGQALDIKFAYPKSILNEALAEVAKRSDFKQAYINFNSTFEEIVQKRLAELSTDPQALSKLQSLFATIEKQFNNQSFSFDIIYSSGSVLAYAGRVEISSKAFKPPEIEKEERIEKESAIDVTVLVKAKVKQRMRRGAGKPRPPKIYERTGAFRNSIRAFFNFRQRTVDYFYEPYYQKLERSGYQVTNLVEDSIRSVIQTKFKQQAQTRRLEL